jgi:hypothetical protein
VTARAAEFRINGKGFLRDAGRFKRRELQLSSLERIRTVAMLRAVDGVSQMFKIP